MQDLKQILAREPRIAIYNPFVAARTAEVSIPRLPIHGVHGTMTISVGNSNPSRDIERRDTPAATFGREPSLLTTSLQRQQKTQILAEPTQGGSQTPLQQHLPREDVARKTPGITSPRPGADKIDSISSPASSLRTPRSASPSSTLLSHTSAPNTQDSIGSNLRHSVAQLQPSPWHYPRSTSTSPRTFLRLYPLEVRMVGIQSTS